MPEFKFTGMRFGIAAIFTVALFWASQAAPQSKPQPGPAPAVQSLEASKPQSTQQKSTDKPKSESEAKKPEEAARFRTKQQRAWAILRDGLAENSAEKRAKAVNALGLLTNSAQAEHAAVEALSDDKANVRVAAATALGSMHATRSRTQLEKALNDDEPAVVLAATNSLMLLRDMRSAYDVYYGVLTGKVRANKGFVREQLKTLRDTKKMAELGFEEGIGFIPFAGFGYGVAKTIMKSDGSSVRAAAAKKLAHDPDPVSADALVAATTDKSWLVRAAALDALSQRGDKSLLPHVALAMSDEKDDVRYTAAACVIHLSGLPAKREPYIASKLN